MSAPPPWSDTDDHPRDVFDDVPEDGPRQGAHRPREAARRRTPAGLKAMVVVGSLGLLLGAVGYVYSTVSGDPRGLEAGGAPAATSAPSASAAPGAEETETEAGSETAAPEDAEQVGVFNATSLDGVAAAGGGEISDLGWEIVATGNWGAPVEESVVYYAGDGVTGDTEDQAQRIAEALGIEQTQSDDAIAYPLVVVLGDDIGQDLLDRSGGQAPDAGTGETAPDQSDEAADPALPEEQADIPTDEVVDGSAGGVAEQPPALPEDAAPPVPAEQAPVDPAGGL